MPRRVDLTPVVEYDGWWAKRDDIAEADDLDAPTGSKVRQYKRMLLAAPDAPLLVGCSANSAMQIYVAAAGKLFNRRAIIYVPERKVATPATNYAVANGAEVRYVKPGYLSCVRSRAREAAKAMKNPVRWDVVGAIRDAAAQTKNIPSGVRRVVVPTGSGLTAAGVLAGLVDRNIPVLAVAVSRMATEEHIRDSAEKVQSGKLGRLTVVYAEGGYEDWKAEMLPTGEYLDPYYAAKAVEYLQSGDLLWVPGRRPLSACPAGWKEEISLRQPFRLR